MPRYYYLNDQQEKRKTELAIGDLYDSLQCHNNHGHCRRLCFYNERPIGTCTNRRQRCCKRIRSLYSSDTD
uniref:Beta-defensin-like domain-containing protein n=1 Tax=Salvator merianae TaxID=96440 RepID=A0A8D0DK89_SALMN